MSVERPNFIFMITDQQRRDSLGCYGNRITATPNINRLAEEGTLFENMFTTNVVCMPSRASYLTGRYPSCHGVRSNGIQLPESETTLPQVLSENGYMTCSIGKIHLSPVKGGLDNPESITAWDAGKRLPVPYYGFKDVKFENAHGFGHYGDYYHDLKKTDKRLPELADEKNALETPSGAPFSWKSGIPEEYHTSTWVADNAVERLKRFSRENKPFFMMVSFPDPHFPFCPPAPYCDMYDPGCVPLPFRSEYEKETASLHLRQRWSRFAEDHGYHPFDMPEKYIREITAYTYGMVSLIDKNVGRILGALDEYSLRDSTTVIFASDHGEHLGDHWLITKMIPYDELIRVPAIWRIPDNHAAGQKIGGSVRNIDFMPAILDIAGIDIPYGVQGQSFAGVFRGEGWTAPENILIENDSAGPFADPSYSRTIRTGQYHMNYYAGVDSGELFDMDDDPQQFRNLWNDEGHRKIKSDLKCLMLEEMVKACDPLPGRYAAY